MARDARRNEGLSVGTATAAGLLVGTATARIFRGEGGADILSCAVAGGVFAAGSSASSSVPATKAATASGDGWLVSGLRNVSGVGEAMTGLQE